MSVNVTPEIKIWDEIRHASAEVGVSHACASHKQVSSLNLQITGKSQVIAVKIGLSPLSSRTSEVIAGVKPQVKSYEILMMAVACAVLCWSTASY